MGLMSPRAMRKTPTLKTNYPTGIVVDNNDPLKQGRIRMRVAGLHPSSIPNNLLPWMLPHQSGQANAGRGIGNVHVPPIGAKLHAMFDGDDPHNATYKHSPPTEDVHKGNPLREMDYPHTYGWKDHGNNLFFVNTKTGEMGIKMKDGSSIIFKDGSLTTTMSKNITTSAKGKHTAKAKGGMIMHSEGALTTKGKTIDNNGPDATEKADDVQDQGEVQSVDTSPDNFDSSGNMVA